MTELSDRYRRLLRWYPRDHRSAHEEEMLGVLLAAARPGQARPTLQEASDLIYGGLRVRAGRAAARASGTGWRDALAVAGVIAPLGLSVNAARLALVWWFSLFDLPFEQAHPDWSAWAIWPLVVVLTLFGARRAACVAAMGAVTWWAVIVGSQYLRYDATAAVVAIWWPLLGLVAIAGLAVQPGPRHGVRVLRQHKTLLAVAGILLAAAALCLVPFANPEAYWRLRDMGAISALAVVAGVLAISSPVGRRLIVVLSAPAASFFLLEQAGDGGPWSNYPVTGLFLILPVAFAVFIISALSLGPVEGIVRLVRSDGW